MLVYLRRACRSLVQRQWLNTARYHSTGNASLHKVLVSTSVNIYENLALEQWLFEKTDLKKDSVLLMWKDAPAVVFGRHQNPWVECSVPVAQKQGVRLARRNSGGGTVYHDEGNLNCSFLTHISQYDRKKNLQLVVDAIKSRWEVNLSINSREDIILDNQYKISGTASRLTRDRAYHHFTLLFNVEKESLKSVLCSNMVGVQSKATASVSMPVANLCDSLTNLDYDGLVHTISEKFLQNAPPGGVHFVHPLDEERFPGVQNKAAELSSWEWIFGKTPSFSIQRRFRQSFSVLENVMNIQTQIVKGRIHDLKVKLMLDMEVDPKALVMLAVGLEECKLSRVEILSKVSQIKMDWIASDYYTVKTQPVLDWVLISLLETLTS